MASHFESRSVTLEAIVAVWFSALITVPLVCAARPLQQSASPPSTSDSNSSAPGLYGSEWLPCKATWYGEPDGVGSDGGACGYGQLASTYGKNVAAVSSVLYHDGLGCGSCFQVKCRSSSHAACSDRPVTVTVTDICPGGELCGVGKPHFDLSGTALSNLAATGKAAELRAVGVIDLLFKRVPCSYPGKTVALAVDAGSNPYSIAFTIKYEEGPGDLSAVELKEGESEWQPMQHKWGANWGFEAPNGLHGVLSVRLTSGLGNLVLVAQNALPADWTPGTTYSAFAISDEGLEKDLSYTVV